MISKQFLYRLTRLPNVFENTSSLKFFSFITIKWIKENEQKEGSVKYLFTSQIEKLEKRLAEIEKEKLNGKQSVQPHVLVL